MIPSNSVLVRRVDYRNPYSIVRLPLLARLHRAAWAPSSRLRDELPKLFLRWAFERLYRLRLGGRGEFKLDVDGRPRDFDFDARNLQFISLYMPQFARGYESETGALLDALVGPRAVFYDVGSNWGYYALWLSARRGFAGRVHAFEPFPANFQDLRALCGQAGLEKRLLCHEFALSNESGAGRMVLPDGLHSGLAALSGAGGVAVGKRRLDDLGLETPDAIKIDAEDHEQEVLAGGLDTIRKGEPYIVFESVWGRQSSARGLAPFTLLAGLGYRFFQPCWKSEDAQDELALIEFELAQRSLLRAHINVLACPKSRTSELERLFPDRLSAL